MEKCVKIILFCVLFLFLMCGCNLQTTIIPVGYKNISFIITICLIGIPYLLGCNIIYFGKRFYFLTILEIGSLIILFGLPFFKIFFNFLLKSPDYQWRFILTAITWFSMGIFFASRAKLYIQTVGIRGYFFTVIGVSFLGACMSSILMDGILIPQLLENKPINLQIISFYMYSFVFFLIIIFPFGIASHVLKIVIKKNLLVVFFTFSIVKFVFEYFWQSSLSSILWWIPNIKSPMAYDWFVNLAISAVISLPC
jgi:hypothetical protein